MTDLPKKYHHQDRESHWRESWEKNGVYDWNSDATRENTFSVDTPPPTVSGSLHIGHVFSYTHTDAIVRYQRMQGKSIFYPMGWDDNGLPTERRVQHVFGITCDPSLPYDPAFKASTDHSLKVHEYTPVSRQNFIEVCQLLTTEDEQVFESLWRKLGLSVDWSLQYETINDHCRLLSQKSFLDCMEKGFVKHVEAPVMWDVDYQTAVAQAEIEDRDKVGAYHDIRFQVEDGSAFVIATTRPELLAACIAVVAHPDDARYQPYFGKFAQTPLFHAKVPILASTHADPEKGTGILMVCTFGDQDDVAWWKQSDLDLKQLIGRDGCLLPVSFGDGVFVSEKPAIAQAHYDTLVGLRVKKARAQMVQLLQAPGSSVDGSTTALVGEPKPTEHPVKFYEKGDSPIELMSSRQWFIDILSHKENLLKQGELIEWKPGFMKSRYLNWVEGLNQDWCISRQRFFGVPFPVWYPLDAAGEPQFDAPLFAAADQLPVDPLTQCPAGFDESQRGKANGFMGDPDVMDTWATSSLTPQLMSHWSLDEARHNQVFPMDIRPQSHEIIRTWAFYTIVKAWIHDQEIPWHHVVISGWVLDPDRKKMSKSKGNVVTPGHLLDKYSSDAIRYWACKARLGTDTAFEETVFSVGQKLVTKLFNASKFVHMQIADFPDLSLADITQAVDQDLIERHRRLLNHVSAAYDRFDYAAALDATESAFWFFCDHYIELVKVRAYREEDVQKKRSALAALECSLSMLCRLFAPVFPYITEEIWSWRFSKNNSSVHQGPWPMSSELSGVSTAKQSDILDVAIQVLSEIRGAKSSAQKNMKHPVGSLQLEGPQGLLDCFELAQADVIRAGSVETFQVTANGDLDALSVSVTL